MLHHLQVAEWGALVVHYGHQLPLVCMGGYLLQVACVPGWLLEPAQLH